MAKNEGGGAGSSGGTTKAVTRLKVVDPHLVMMMRDVMDASETAARLKVGGGAGSGGGGAGAPGDDQTTTGGGLVGTAGVAQSNAINTGEGSVGGKGGDSPTNAAFGEAKTTSGPGGGGGGGIGGALVIITTSPDIGTTSTAGGFKGTKGTAQGS